MSQWKLLYEEARGAVEDKVWVTDGESTALISDLNIGGKMKVLEIEDNVKDIIATMRIEGMELTPDVIENVRSILKGEKNADELVKDIKRRYGVK